MTGATDWGGEIDNGYESVREEERLIAIENTERLRLADLIAEAPWLTDRIQQISDTFTAWSKDPPEGDMSLAAMGRSVNRHLDFGVDPYFRELIAKIIVQRERFGRTSSPYSISVVMRCALHRQALHDQEGYLKTIQDPAAWDNIIDQVSGKPGTDIPAYSYFLVDLMRNVQTNIAERSIATKLACGLYLPSGLRPRMLDVGGALGLTSKQLALGRRFYEYEIGQLQGQTDSLELVTNRKIDSRFEEIINGKIDFQAITSLDLMHPDVDTDLVDWIRACFRPGEATDQRGRRRINRFNSLKSASVSNLHYVSADIRKHDEVQEQLGHGYQADVIVASYVLYELGQEAADTTLQFIEEHLLSPNGIIVVMDAANIATGDANKLVFDENRFRTSYGTGVFVKRRDGQFEKLCSPETSRFDKIALNPENERVRAAFPDVA